MFFCKLIIIHSILLQSESVLTVNYYQFELCSDSQGWSSDERCCTTEDRYTWSVRAIETVAMYGTRRSRFRGPSISHSRADATSNYTTVALFPSVLLCFCLQLAVIVSLTFKRRRRKLVRRRADVRHLDSTLKLLLPPIWLILLKFRHDYSFGCISFQNEVEDFLRTELCMFVSWNVACLNISEIIYACYEGTIFLRIKLNEFNVFCSVKRSDYTYTEIAFSYLCSCMIHVCFEEWSGCNLRGSSPS